MSRASVFAVYHMSALRSESYECSSLYILLVHFVVHPVSARRRVSHECYSQCILRVFINTCSFLHDLTSLAVCLKKNTTISAWMLKATAIWWLTTDEVVTVP